MIERKTKKRWLKQILKIGGETFHLFDFHHEKGVAEKIKREAIDEGVKSVKIIYRKRAYFEQYPSGKPFIQAVYAVYVRN